MLVNHYYSSDQVERFKIEGRDRWIKMEKRLLHKGTGNGWKLIDGSIISRYNTHIPSVLVQITGAIDQYLESRDIKQTTGYIDYLKFKKRY